MNREELFARRICEWLDESARQLPPDIAERLRAARERALAYQPLPAELPLKVGAGGTAVLGHGHEADDEQANPWRTLLAIVALLIGMAFSYYWNGFDAADLNEEIDSALLADDLSPKAYLDPGFQAWLSHYAQESAR
ncbi:MAG: DUF3619 family protein [Rhodocyclaceae bacterium]|nr:DUF3619 family protein [Rhodocyclaceae bacterium]